MVELNNIVCYDDKGEFIWSVDNKLPIQIASKEQTPYVAIQVQDNILKATVFFRRKFHINFADGRLLQLSHQQNWCIWMNACLRKIMHLLVNFLTA